MSQKLSDNSPRYRHISIAIPMMAESENVPHLIELLKKQTHKEFRLYCCVNNEEHCDQSIYIDNQKTLALLRSCTDIDISIIDRSSTGNGWLGKKKGVGWARKLLFSAIDHTSEADELIVSLDADTDFPNHYLEKLLLKMNQCPYSSALSVPYYHPLSNNESLDRPMLRYECYMRHYLIHLLSIHSPYAFTALGSAMAFPLWAYRRVGGITPLQGGEDFYLMQKFAKTGHIENHLDCRVEPQGRISHRVPFGTGPAIAKGIDEMDLIYPFYSEEGFLRIRQTYDLLPTLYQSDTPTPMTDFLQQQLNTTDIWGPLRRNYKTQEQFVHACHERIDGLRILQYLRHLHLTTKPPINFSTEPIETLNQYRNQLYQQEMALR